MKTDYASKFLEQIDFCFVCYLSIFFLCSSHFHCYFFINNNDNNNNVSGAKHASYLCWLEATIGQRDGGQTQTIKC